MATSAMGKRAKPQSIGAVIETLIKDFGIEKKIKGHQAVALWGEIVGEKIARVTEARKVEDGVLFVRVHNSVWRNELTMRKLELIKMINDRMKRNTVSDIVFR